MPVAARSERTRKTADEIVDRLKTEFGVLYRHCHWHGRECEVEDAVVAVEILPRSIADTPQRILVDLLPYPRPNMMRPEFFDGLGRWQFLSH